MALISQLSVNLAANTKGLQKGLNKARRQIRKFIGGLSSMKTLLFGALGIGGIGVAVSDAFSAFSKQENAERGLEAVNRSMGRTRDMTAQVIAQAKKLQKQGIIGDEELIDAGKFLASFSTIPDEMMPRALAATADIMAMTQMGAKEAANMVGRASMGLAGALSRSGITFEQDTLAAIKAQAMLKSEAEKTAKAISLAAAGTPVKLETNIIGQLTPASKKALELNNEMKRLAQVSATSFQTAATSGEIFNLMLRDIESQVGGVNKAMADGAAGPWAQMSNSIGDMKEEFGKVIATAFNPWIQQAGEYISAFSLDTQSAAGYIRELVRAGVKGFAPFLDVLDGISMVISGIELGLRTVGLAFTDVFGGIVSGFGNLFDNETAKEFGKFLEEVEDSQYNKIIELQKDIGQKFDDLSNRKSSRDFLNAFNEFDRAAFARRPVEPPVVPAISTRANTSSLMIKVPEKLDTQIDILRQIRDQGLIPDRRTAIAS